MAHNLYRKDKTDYTFVIDNSMLQKAHKLKIVCFKRDKKNKRIDMAEFYEDYKSLRAILDLLYAKWYKGKGLKISRFGGTDGQRRLTYDLLFSVGAGSKLTFWFEDLISKEKYDGYTGKMMYSISETLDLQELFNLRETLNNWELLNLTNVMAQDDTKETDST